MQNTQDAQQSNSPVAFSKKLLGVMILYATITVITVFCAVILILSTPPTSWTGEKMLEIDRGMSIKAITQRADEEGVVRSSTLLYLALNYFHGETQIYAGTYVFSQPLSVFGVADKLAVNDVQNNLTTLTLPEGYTAAQIAQIADETLDDFDVDAYIDQAGELEGYLFPDTYFVPQDFSAQELVDLQRSTYEERLKPFQSAIEQSSFTEYEVLILASIIEREANDDESMRTVSGILQNRLAIGMALQADASVGYVLDKPLSELTPEDLDIDSPYNTYQYPGLVPTPIGNPGLQSILAVLEPIETEYFYYLTDNDGTFHYARTLEEHNRNVRTYLR